MNRRTFLIRASATALTALPLPALAMQNNFIKGRCSIHFCDGMRSWREQRLCLYRPATPDVVIRLGYHMTLTHRPSGGRIHGPYQSLRAAKAAYDILAKCNFSDLISGLTSTQRRIANRRTFAKNNHGANAFKLFEKADKAAAKIERLAA